MTIQKQIKRKLARKAFVNVRDASILIQSGMILIAFQVLRNSVFWMRSSPIVQFDLVHFWFN